MALIVRRLNCSALLLALCIFFTVLSDPAQIAWASLVSSFLIVLLIGLSIQQSQLLQSARLIWDNRIWVVPVTRLDQGSGSAFLVEETVLSTFGLLSA
ncbi:MAG TPA: hypothetical protein DDW87_02030, partial [Firmicutes bacterium]|nr:hypothetical protein [Bacillota bacterium]